MRNQALYAHLRQFCADASAKILAVSDGGKQLPVINERRVRFESGVFSEVAERVVPWGDVLSQLEPALRDLPSYKQAAETMEADERVARHLEVLVGPAGGNAFRLSADDGLRKLLFDLIDEQNGLAFQGAIFSGLYSRVEDYFYSPTLRYRLLAPLDQFSTDADRVDLEDGVAIIRLSDDDKGWLATQSGGIRNFVSLRMHEFAFELFLARPKVFGNAADNPLISKEARMKFDDLQSALRIFRPGKVHYNSVWEIGLDWSPVGERTEHFTFFRPSRQRFGPEYLLTTEDVPDFKGLWSLSSESLVSPIPRTRFDDSTLDRRRRGTTTGSWTMLWVSTLCSRIKSRTFD